MIGLVVLLILTLGIAGCATKQPRTAGVGVGGSRPPSLLDNFHAREVLHVTFGSAIVRWGMELKQALVKHETVYQEALQVHFEKHLRLLQASS